MLKRLIILLLLANVCLLASAANYLTFTAEADGSTFRIKNENGNNIQYSLDSGKTWTVLADGDTILLARKGNKALLRGDNPQGLSHANDRYTNFIMTGAIAASGSVMSLIDGVGESKTIPSDGCFRMLFYLCKSLTQAPELPATQLAKYCYSDMFRACFGLKQAPQLPATQLAEGCYRRMFSNCYNLTEAPELPATQLVKECYSFMFDGCRQFSYIKVGFADWGEQDELSYFVYHANEDSPGSGTPEERKEYIWRTNCWLSNVAPSGTFVCPKELHEEFGSSRIPEGWKIIMKR